VRKLIVIAVLAAIGAAVAAAPALAAVPTGNLLANPGAEAAPALEASGDYGSPQGWTSVVPAEGDQGPYDFCYDDQGDEVERAFGDPIDGGARFFFGGRIATATIQQDVAVPPEAASRTLLIGGEFGGYQSQEDNAILEARFLNAEGLSLGAISTAPVSAADRDGVTAFVRREATGTVPATTRTIRFILDQIRLEGSDNDGYADNLFATFDPTAPAPPVPLGDPECPLAQPPAPPAAPVATPAPSPSPAPPSPAPAVTITRGPGHETAAGGAVFEFAGTPGGTYECALDGGPWKSCASGHDFGPARPGDHLFEVREVLYGVTGAPVSYRWTVDLPRACVLRVARARVFVFTRLDKARLVIHYTTYKPAKVAVSYALQGTAGGLAIGSATARFKTAGVFRLPVRLTKAQTRKARAAKRLAVHFKIPETPRSCGRYYAKQLTIPRRISGQTVWFQSDSVFASH
jgi:hypothetical protein